MHIFVYPVLSTTRVIQFPVSGNPKKNCNEEFFLAWEQAYSALLFSYGLRLLILEFKYEEVQGNWLKHNVPI